MDFNLVQNEVIGFLSTPSARRATRKPLRGVLCIQFLSTPSARRATACAGVFVYLVQFLSTPSARRATFARARVWEMCAISIHALREEGDPLPHRDRRGRHPISIHALREEGDRYRRRRGQRPHSDFYPRPPRGGRQAYASRPLYPVHISIHALREEGDRAIGDFPRSALEISIHALREEGDIRRAPNG